MGTFPAQTVESLMGLDKPKNTDVMMVGCSLIHHARNNMVKYALDNDYEYLMFIDSDMVLPQDTITKLMAHDKDIISARAHKRVYPYSPCFYIDDKPVTEYKGLMEVDSVGMACCIIKTEVFKDIKYPFDFTTGVGEDIAFCKRAKEKGYSVWVDTDLEVGHVGTTVFGERHFKAVQG